jgi:hypothetical protein
MALTLDRQPFERVEGEVLWTSGDMRCVCVAAPNPGHFAVELVIEDVVYFRQACAKRTQAPTIAEEFLRSFVPMTAAEACVRAASVRL